MAISEAYQNSQTVGTTEHDLPSDTTSLGAVTDDGIYQAWIELNNLAAGDVFEFRVYEKISSGGTQRICFEQSFTGNLSVDLWVSPSFVLLHGWTMSLIKLAGTDRSISWSIRKVA